MPKGAPATESDRATAALDYIASREGLLLVTQLVVSRNKYLFYVGDSAPTMGGLRRVHGDLNLDRRFDSRVNPRRPGGRKAPNERPPDGFDGLVAVNPRATWYNVQTDQGIPFHCLVFHELAEAYGKVSLRLQYLPGHGFPGAHELALEREINLQN
ncbi:MAG TPA: hypothetical protein VEZ90_00985, partial [Blastocatellia bacterium]|nr:hypothetical protein [Blastocatellia bacterium]